MGNVIIKKNTLNITPLQNNEPIAQNEQLLVVRLTKMDVHPKVMEKTLTTKNLFQREALAPVAIYVLSVLLAIAASVAMPTVQ